MAVAPLLQLRAIVRARSSAGLSLGYLSVLLVGFVLWLCYGLSIGNAPVIVANATALVVSGITLLVALRFRPATTVTAVDAPAEPAIDAAAGLLAPIR
jgi:uncharacterized protein with PQ loop repeat